MSLSDRIAATRYANGVAMVLTLVILAGAGVAVAATVTDPYAHDIRFLPADGAADPVRLQVGDPEAPSGDPVSATVEHALITGGDITVAAPYNQLRASPSPSDRPPTEHLWWREVLATGSLYAPAPRIRLRSVTEDGVRLHSQGWDQQGLAYDPAPIELPADVRPGQRWSDQGRATAAGIGGDGWAPYRHTAQAERAEDPVRARRGCLRVRSSTRIERSPADTLVIAESQTWCPGRGVVESSGSIGDVDFTVTPGPGLLQLKPDQLAEPTEIAPSADWSAVPLRTDLGDSGFGPAFETLDVTDYRHGTSVDSVGSLHVPFGADAITGFPTTTPGTVWMHGRLHPGGKATAIGSFGETTVVAGSRRVLRAYDLFGRVRWTVPTPDVVAVPPVAVPGERLLVATVSGQVMMLDALSGRELWRRQLPGPITVPPDADGRIAVVATDHEMFALDLTDGARLWAYDTDRIEPELFGDVVVVGDWSSLTGLSRRTGRELWTVTSLRSDLVRLTRFGEHLAVATTSGLQLRSPQTGRSVVDLPLGTVHDAVPVGGRLLVLTDDEVIAIDHTGEQVARWPQRSTLRTGQRLLTYRGGVLALGDDGVAGLAGTVIAPESDP